MRGQSYGLPIRQTRQELIVELGHYLDAFVDVHDRILTGVRQTAPEQVDLLYHRSFNLSHYNGGSVSYYDESFLGMISSFITSCRQFESQCVLSLR